ncbi:MAG: hypothetical protein GY725_24885 [bacterium]|nr:hypothetical protein [bacterium]
MSIDYERESNVEQRVMLYYHRPIAHLWRRHKQERLCPVIGAGVSTDLGLPTWSQLVERLTRHKEISYSGPIDENDPASAADRIYHHLYTRVSGDIRQNAANDAPEATIIKKFNAAWKRAITAGLYGQILQGDTHDRVTDLSIEEKKKIAERLEGSIKRHGYLERLYPIIRNAHLTINYNFDDSLQRLIGLRLTAEEREQEGRGHETFVNVAARGQRNTCRLYHPNGFLPMEDLERPSDSVTLTGSELIGRTLTKRDLDTTLLRSHLQSHTTLVIGMSLRDVTQQRIYREIHEQHPGHIHYMVEYLSDTKTTTHNGELVKVKLTTEERFQKRSVALASCAAMFMAYGIYPLPLFPEEIGPLLGLLSRSEDHINTVADDARVSLNHRYYIVGAPGSGKSSVVEILSSVIAHDEWPEPRPDLLAKDYKRLSPDEQQTVEAWIDRQFRIKNKRLGQNQVGIHLIDRSPLDPLSYTKSEEERRKRARVLKTKLVHSIAPGHVFRIDADPSELHLRLLPQLKTSELETLREMTEDMRELYPDKLEGVTPIDSRFLSLNELVTIIANYIFLENLPECDLEGLLQEAADGE